MAKTIKTVTYNTQDQEKILDLGVISKEKPTLSSGRSYSESVHHSVQTPSPGFGLSIELSLVDSWAQ